MTRWATRASAMKWGGQKKDIDGNKQSQKETWILENRNRGFTLCDEERIFWKKIKRFRTLHFLTLLSLPFTAAVVHFSVIALTGNKPSELLKDLLLITIFLAGFYWIVRIRRLHCPRCKRKTPIANCYNFLRNMKCRYCRFSYSEAYSGKTSK